jgi:hypothetical protein
MACPSNFPERYLAQNNFRLTLAALLGRKPLRGAPWVAKSASFNGEAIGQPAYARNVKAPELLQIRVLRSRFFQNGDIRVRVFPEGEENLIGRLRLSPIARLKPRPGHLGFRPHRQLVTVWVGEMKAATSRKWERLSRNFSTCTPNCHLRR